MLVIFSAFKTGLDESGRTSCELKRAWDVSEHSERFPSQAKCPRSNTPREAMEPRLNGKNGRQAVQPTRIAGRAPTRGVPSSAVVDTLCSSISPTRASIST
jgi:hypothetical protein